MEIYTFATLFYLIFVHFGVKQKLGDITVEYKHRKSRGPKFYETCKEYFQRVKLEYKNKCSAAIRKLFQKFQQERGEF